MLKLAVVVCCLVYASALLSIGDEWMLYKKSFGKSYSEEEDRLRFSIFMRNVERINRHNKHFEQGEVSFKLGISQLTDMTTNEVTARYNGYRPSLVKDRRPVDVFRGVNYTVADTVDWRTKGLVTPVKNQAQCGSCWAFSTTGSLEGQHKLKTGNLVSLSEQNLMDCSKPEGDHSCQGGLMDNAFRYIIKNGGVDTEQSYPYEARNDRCRFKKSNVGATVSSYKDIPSGNEDALKQASATIGPISVAIDANHFAFQSYRSGVLDIPSCSSTQLDHGVLVVGYGTEDGKDYWLVKNSWGASWGDKGYLKMSRNKDNQCGIATQASYPIV